MPGVNFIRPLLRLLGILGVVYVGVVATVYFRQRSMLFFPTHSVRRSELVPWTVEAGTIGYCRERPRPPTIWLMLHGNAGQAADREYVLPRLSGTDSLYVVEYPGYGLRDGSPSRVSMNKAASEAYQWLRSRNPGTPVCVLGESIGSGPACELAREPVPPDKIVLVVPFDSLERLASRRFPFLPIHWMLLDRWDNAESLRTYRGPVEVIGAKGDAVIPIAHAEALVQQVSQAQFTAIPGGHNDWADCDQVRIKH